MSESRRTMLGLGAGILSAGVLTTERTMASVEATSQAKTLFNLPQTQLPIAGMAAVFPVRRIYCIGRNYADHAREMGSNPRSEQPLLFQKPDDSVQIIPADTMVDHPYPPLTKNYHHELELVAVLQGGAATFRFQRRSSMYSDTRSAST